MKKDKVLVIKHFIFYNYFLPIPHSRTYNNEKLGKWVMIKINPTTGTYYITDWLLGLNLDGIKEL